MWTQRIWRYTNFDYLYLWRPQTYMCIYSWLVTRLTTQSTQLRSCRALEGKMPQSEEIPSFEVNAKTSDHYNSPDVEFSSWLYGASLRCAFHYHPSVWFSVERDVEHQIIITTNRNGRNCTLKAPYSSKVDDILLSKKCLINCYKV